MNKTILSIKGLSKKYKDQNNYALENINLEVQKQDIIGIIGPNGAGKSTLIKLILGVLEPTSGEIEFMGKNPIYFNNQDKKQFGAYLGGKSSFGYQLPVIDSVKFYSRLYDVPKNLVKERIYKYSKVLDVEPYLKQRVSTLSLGQRLRAELLCILVYEPSILILDEPTIGLDIDGKRTFRNILRDLQQKTKVTIFLTTHELNDLDRIADRVVMLQKGRLLFDYPREELLNWRNRFIIITSNIKIEHEGILLIETVNNSHRYLVEKSIINRITNLFKNSQNLTLYSESEPSLEDMLYEYYS